MEIWTAYQFIAPQASVHYLLPASVVMELDLHKWSMSLLQAGFIERAGVCEGVQEPGILLLGLECCGFASFLFVSLRC